MGNVTESIWDGESRIIPLAEVSHIEKYGDTAQSKKRILVVFKHSKTNHENGGDPEPSVYMDQNSGSESFLREWCRYRSELESETLANIH